MVSFTTVDAKYAIESQTPKFGADVKINDDVKFRLDVNTKSNSANIKATLSKFTISHDLSKKDSEFSYKNGSLSVKQKVPQGNFYLIPTPIVTYTKDVGQGWTLGTEYDFGARVGLLQGIYKFGEDDMYKADFGVKTNQARWLKLEYAPKDDKVNAKLTLCSKTGATARFELKPAKEVKLNSELRQSGESKVVGTYTKRIQGSDVSVVLEASVSGNVIKGGKATTATTVGLKWTP